MDVNHSVRAVAAGLVLENETKWDSVGSSAQYSTSILLVQFESLAAAVE